MFSISLAVFLAEIKEGARSRAADDVVLCLLRSRNVERSQVIPIDAVGGTVQWVPQFCRRRAGVVVEL